MAGELPSVESAYADGVIVERRNRVRDVRMREEMVKGHLKRIFLKIGVTDRTQAIIVASQRGILLL